MASTPCIVTTKQAEALAEMYVWDTIVEILEGSTAPVSASGRKAALRVIAIAKAEQRKLFRKYDAEARHDATATLQAEVERLRAEVDRSERYAEQSERERLWVEARAERLAEALRYAVKQVPELATVPGIAAALEQESNDA